VSTLRSKPSKELSAPEQTPDTPTEESKPKGLINLSIDFDFDFDFDFDCDFDFDFDCWLLIVDCWLLIVDCWLLIVDCWLLIVVGFCLFFYFSLIIYFVLITPSFSFSLHFSPFPSRTRFIELKPKIKLPKISKIFSQIQNLPILSNRKTKRITKRFPKPYQKVFFPFLFSFYFTFFLKKKTNFLYLNNFIALVPNWTLCFIKVRSANRHKPKAISKIATSKAALWSIFHFSIFNLSKKEICYFYYHFNLLTLHLFIFQDGRRTNRFSTDEARLFAEHASEGCCFPFSTPNSISEIL